VTYTHLQAGSKHKIIGEEKDANGNVWYKLDQDKGIKRPNRIKGSWYVLASETKPGKELLETPFDAQKKIVISIKEQKIRAYEGEKLVHEAKTATGLYKYPTPIGTFKILRKVQTRYMQNGFGSDYFDLPGIAGTMYFTGSGHAIHGAYWHNAFGTRRSHGCVNVPNEDAEWLYEWAAIGTTVVINK
jgi:lipoprotein-anchoring transpeptidase ErfK/SrfK